MVTVSLICPIYNEGKFISSFIESVLRQDYPKSNTEVLLLDGMSTDNTREIISDYTAKYEYIKMLDNPQHVVPYSLNKGIRMSKGDVVVRLDAHCVYPDNYVSRLVDELYRLDADNVGGVWNTIPANDSIKCIAIALASSHPFGVGGSEHKIGAKRTKLVDTVPFGCYKREVFDRIGLFDEELTRNQDDELNARLINNGGKIYLVPDVVITYTARDSMQKMRKMYYQYGLYKPLVNKKLGKPATVRQFFPALFVMGVMVGLPFCFVSDVFAVIYIVIAAVYWLLGLCIGISKAKKFKRLALAVYIPWTFFNVHMSYGIGYLVGIYKIMTNRKFNVQFNR